MLVDPRGEPRAYESSPSVDLFVCPRMAHMHNFAGHAGAVLAADRDVGGLGAGARGAGSVTGSDALMDLELAEDLPSLLTLERVDRDLFRGRNANYGPRQTLYGGQVAAQCLLAAAATVEPDRLPHSLHGYFLRPGRSDLPVILEVDRDRDGRSFSARHVVAVQEGEVIFSMITSFHAEREGGRLRRRAPARRARARGHPAKAGGTRCSRCARSRRPTSSRACSATACGCAPRASLGDDPLMHRAALTYLSDLGTGFGQQDQSLIGRGGPSHRPLRVVPGGHPGRRLGARRPASGQGPQRARGVPRLAARPPRRARAPRSTRSSSCCPGSMARPGPGGGTQTGPVPVQRAAARPTRGGTTPRSGIRPDGDARAVRRRLAIGAGEGRGDSAVGPGW